VIESLRKATFNAAATTPYEHEIRRATASVLVDRVMALASGSPMPQVRAIASAALSTISRQPLLRQHGAGRLGAGR
jgi:hypothetical protein